MRLDELLAKALRLELKSRYLARSHFGGLYRSAFKGQGMEFAEVREYTEGDDIRLIDWNVSARSHSLYVKKMVEERERNILLLLDTSGSLRFGTVRRTKFDLLVELASLFVLTAFYARDRLSLALATSRVDLFIPPAKGWNHAARLIREMVSRQAIGRVADMEAVWNFLNSPGVRRSLVILLTDFTVPLAASNHFCAATRKHEILAIFASDPREWSLPNVGLTRLEDPETGQVKVIHTGREEVRSEFHKRAAARRSEVLRILGVNDVDWAEFSTGTDYEASLRRFLEARALRRGYRHP